MLHGKITTVAAAMAVAVGLAWSSAGLAGNHAEPGNGPPDCPGTPGAFIAGAAQQLAGQQTPPGEVVAQIAQDPGGSGAGDTARETLAVDCGIGALPQAE